MTDDPCGTVTPAPFAVANATAVPTMSEVGLLLFALAVGKIAALRCIG